MLTSFWKKSLVVLAASVYVTSGVCALAQVGPVPPQPKQTPASESKIKESLTKFFGKTKTEKEDKDNTPTPEAVKSGKPDLTPVEPDKAEMMGGGPAAVQEEGPPRRPPMLTQPPLTNAKIEAPEVDPENPPVVDHPKLDDPKNPLGLSDAANRLKNVITLIDANRASEAKASLVPLRQWLVDSTEAHINLYKTLNTVPSARAQAELEKQLALEFAKLRDRSLLELGKVYIAEKDYLKAVKELTEVVKSQPRSQLGIRSYELLQEIGFTEKLQLTQ
jgi:hypothetical protein